MKVQIVYALPGLQRLETIDLPDGETVGGALMKARDSRLFADDQMGYAGLARFGKPVTEQDVLADGDRIELLRLLVADPKETRRRRAEVQARRKLAK